MRQIYCAFYYIFFFVWLMWSVDLTDKVSHGQSKGIIVMIFENSLINEKYCFCTERFGYCLSSLTIGLWPMNMGLRNEIELNEKKIISIFECELFCGFACISRMLRDFLNTRRVFFPEQFELSEFIDLDLTDLRYANHSHTFANIFECLRNRKHYNAIWNGIHAKK